MTLKKELDELKHAAYHKTIGSLSLVTWREIYSDIKNLCTVCSDFEFEEPDTSKLKIRIRACTRLALADGPGPVSHLKKAIPMLRLILNGIVLGQAVPADVYAEYESGPIETAPTLNDNILQELRTYARLSRADEAGDILDRLLWLYDHNESEYSSDFCKALNNELVAQHYWFMANTILTLTVRTDIAKTIKKND